MKTNKFLLGTLAFLSMGVMASCSNEDGPAINDGAEQTGERYMAVRISSSAVSGTRADDLTQHPAGTTDYEVGTDKENAISAQDIRFYFFTDKYEPFLLSASNVNGDVTPTNVVKPISLSGDIHDGNYSSSLEGVLVLGKAADQAYVGKVPSYVLCAANLSDSEFANLANKSLEDLYDEIVSMGNLQKFKMTSTTYLKKNENRPDGAGWDRVICSKIEPSSVSDDPEVAKKNPVDIYIERQVVKVRTKGIQQWDAVKTQGSTSNEYEFVDANNAKTTKNLVVKLTGWKLRNTANTARMFKNISKSVNYFTGWNDETYHRSHWAITPSTLVPGNTSYDIYKSETFNLGNYDSNNKDENVAYTYPNTTFSGYVGDNDFDAKEEHPLSMTDRTTGATAVVIRGEVGVEEDGEFKALDIVRWAGSIYLTEDFQALVAKEYDIEKKNDPGTTDASMVHFDTKTDATQANKHVVTIVKTVNGTEDVDLFDRFNNVEHWIDGVTSYYVNIQHATNPDGEALYGVVRNHIYEHEITGVVGLGVPGNEPKNPEKEAESFVACRLNVLNWGLVSRPIVLE